MKKVLVILLVMEVVGRQGLGRTESAFTCPFTILSNGTMVYDAENQTKKDVDNEFEDHDDIIWCLPKKYTLERPPFVGRKFSHHHLNLKFTFDIREISEIDDRGQSLSIPMYLTVAWTDDRLWINESHFAWNENMTGPKNKVTEDPKVLEELWVPDLEIYGLEHFGQKSVLKEMSGLRMWKDKTIEFNTRVTIRISCRMVFDNYPFDSHICNFQVGSYYYLKNIVTCSSTYKDPIGGDPSRQRNLQHHISFSNLTDEDTTIELTSGEYAACGFRIHLERKRYQLIFQIYLPVILFVCVSWVSFLIRPEVVPGRMALLVTLFLVLINIFNTVRSSAPIPASTTLNAIDSYLVVSILMVFLALLEYAVVLFAINIQDYQEVRRKKHCFRAALARNPEIHGSSISRPLSPSMPHPAKKSDVVNSGLGAAASATSSVGVRRNVRSRISTSNSREKNHFSDSNSDEDPMNDNRSAIHGMQEIIDEINANLVCTSPIRVLLKGDYYSIGRLSIRRFDLVALVILPSIFILYNIYYWIKFNFFIS